MSTSVRLLARNIYHSRILYSQRRFLQKCGIVFQSKTVFCNIDKSSLFAINQQALLSGGIRSMASQDCRHMDVSQNSHFKMLLIPELCDLVSAFQKRGFSIRVVGGAVRDILIGKDPPKDIDLSTNATPDDMQTIFKEEEIHYIETGLQHGTLTAHINGHDFEVTTLRVDVETFGRKAIVEFTSDWRVDAERRDLTINAMSLDIDGKVYDYFNGISDLENHNVCFVGDPRKRIEEDYLRILRYFRFHGRISAHADGHDPQTLNVIEGTAVGLRAIAVERIWVEVERILCGNHAPSLLGLMYKLGVAEHIGLPSHCPNRLDHFGQVWNQAKVCKLHPVTLLTSLVNNAKEADALCTKWKLSNAERNLSRFIATHRDHHSNHLELCQMLLARHANAQTLSTLHSNCLQLLTYLGLHNEEAELRTWNIPIFPVTGADLKHELDMKPGPLMGKLLHKLKESWLHSGYVMTKEDLLNKAKSH